MIVRTYGRRTRCIGRSFPDGGGGGEDDAGGAEGSEFPLSQDISQDPFAFTPAFSSQDSSPWSLDPDLFVSIREPDDSPANPLLLLPDGDSSDGVRRPGKKGRNLKRGSGGEFKNPKAITAVAPATATATATLMEAQEFGEMMEHVDEVNFALDGLRPGQPARIRRASLLSLLSICGTAQQRRLLRAQGMAKRIIDAILGLNFDDSPSTVAAAALFYVLASDVQDDHLLDSPSCIHFLLKLLNPPMADTVEDKAPTIGCKLLGIRKPQMLIGTNKGIDSSSRAIISKVHEILLSCKEIKSGSGEDEGSGRPELSSKWIALLTMEKACLSTVSFEDTSEMVRRVGGNFKERLRELGGLDAIFNVISSCHSTMEGWLKHNSPSISELKDGVVLQSVVLLLKCLKIMENATFLSKDNQNHLLCMKEKLDTKGSPLSFVGVIISSIKFLSGLSLLRSSCSISNPNNEKSTCPLKSFDAHFYHASEVQLKNRRDDQDGISTSDYAVLCGIEDSCVKNIEVCHKRQKLFASVSELSASGSEMTVACGGALSGSSGKSFINASAVNINANGLKVNSIKGSNGWISIRAIGSKTNSCGPSKRPHMSEDVKGEYSKDSYDPFVFDEGNRCISVRAIGSETNSRGLSKRPHMSEDVKGEYSKDSYDPFVFDEDELGPSKWELLARKKEPSQTLQSTVTDKEFVNGYKLPSITTDHELSQLTNKDSRQSCEYSCALGIEEESNVLEDCLLTSVKVLMNLTNDNPVGCQKIAACGGLDTMASLIINHFPSFDLCSPMNSQSNEDIPSSSQSINASHLENKHRSDHELDFLVAILGLLVNLVEKDSRNRLRLASARVLVDRPGRSESKESHRDAIPLLCSIFLANQGAGEAAEEGRLLLDDDEAALMQGEREAEMMIIEAYAALLLAFLSTESKKVREAIASCLPNHNLQVLVPVLERFVAFHLTLNMISPETHSAVIKVIESCKEP